MLVYPEHPHADAQILDQCRSVLLQDMLKFRLVPHPARVVNDHKDRFGVRVGCRDDSRVKLLDLVYRLHRPERGGCRGDSDSDVALVAVRPFHAVVLVLHNADRHGEDHCFSGLSDRFTNFFYDLAGARRLSNFHSYTHLPSGVMFTTWLTGDRFMSL